MQRICSRDRPDDERQHYQPNMYCLFSIKTVSYQSIHYLFLQTFRKHFPYKNKYASHNLNHVEQFKKNKNETSSLTIANNLKLQIKRQQMDYGLRVVIFSTRPGLRLRSRHSRHTWLLRVCFPELTVVFQEHMLPPSS